MFSIVIVSHSRKLAQSLSSLASEVSSVKIPVAYSGGAGGSSDLSGTDATDILSAIESVYTAEGVIVFTDIGSSVLSAELALDLLDDDKKSHVYLSKAPLVEGVLSASVQCASGSDAAFALSEAEMSLSMKGNEYLPSAVPAVSISAAERTVIPASADKQVNQNHKKITAKFIIMTIHGLHARPASAFVRAVSASGCAVEVTNNTTGKGPANGKSLNQLASLEILTGHEISVSAEGDNPEELIKELSVLIENNFGEGTGTWGGIGNNGVKETGSGNSSTDSLCDDMVPAGKEFVFSEGIGIGPVYVLPDFSIEVPLEYTDDTAAAIEFLESAVLKVKKGISVKKEKLILNRKNNEADILDAHLAILGDPDLLDKSISLIKENKYTAPFAFSKCAGEIINRYKKMADPYMRMREADVRDVSHQVLSILEALTLNREEPSAYFSGLYDTVPEGSVIVSSDLTPSAVLKLYNKKSAGLILSRGSTLSHAAIIARALGIPGIGNCGITGDLKNGDTAAVDGYSGEVFINPLKNITDLLILKQKKHREETAHLLDAAGKNAVTKDGIHIPVYANISTAEEAEIAARKGADGVGVIRSEFLFIHSEVEPSEDGQYNYFHSIFTAMDGKPVTVRTFDIGGDKRVPFVGIPEEENPYLGRRGIRLYDTNPSIIKRQLRAVLRAGAGHNIRLMLPMVSQQSEVVKFRSFLNGVHTELEKENTPHLWPIPLGIMIETPSSVVMAEELALVSDFFSIGTNDLTQYIMAAERGTADLSSWADPFDPAVLRSIRAAAEAGKKNGIPVSLCGEMGADPDAVGLILGLGISSISAGPDRIPLIKHIISGISVMDSEKIALEIVSKAVDTSDVRRTCGFI
ncbi:MAG: phosphoenolpyruvate--protein phosphotransferase [Spirochaetales bacterium]|nr:phosphoenolpyruvate--protein phosphotransferase [Spirochaetales bacterium]